MSAQLPASLYPFVAKWQTAAVPATSTDEYPHGEYYWRTTACVCLSGRVKPTAECEPNKTDIERVCKEANFNQYLFADVAQFLTIADVLTAAKYGGDPYGCGRAFAAFWSRDVETMRALIWDGISEHLRARSGLRPSLRPAVWQSGLREFVTLFFSLFQRSALPWDRANEAFGEFCTLPPDDLRAYAAALGLDRAAIMPDEWQPWIEPQGTQALLGLMTIGRWIFATDRTGLQVYLGQPGAIMLGLAALPPLPPTHRELAVQSDLSVLAGVDLSADTLATLFKYCKIERFDDVTRLRLNPKALREAPAGTSPRTALAAALAAAGALPQTVAKLLGDTADQAGGVLRYLGCSAILTADDPAALSAVRAHSKLKGYLVPGGPPGILVIRPDRDPGSFLQRCQDLGYKLKPWSAKP